MAASEGGGNGAGRNGDNIAQVVTDVSERMSLLVREEIELAKAEMTLKATTIAKGAVAVGAGAVFGVFAILFGLATMAWAINAIVINGAGDIWIGFIAVTAWLLILMIGAFLFAWRKLRVGAPTPDMAIDEARKIRETVAANPIETGIVKAPEAEALTPTETETVP